MSARRKAQNQNGLQTMTSHFVPFNPILPHPHTHTSVKICYLYYTSHKHAWQLPFYNLLLHVIQMSAFCGNVSCSVLNYVNCVLVFTAVFYLCNPMHGVTSISELTSPTNRSYSQQAITAPYRLLPCGTATRKCAFSHTSVLPTSEQSVTYCSS